MTEELERAQKNVPMPRGLANRNLRIGRVPRIEGWNDEVLETLRSKILWRYPTRREYKKILSRFYDFYFLGTIREGDNLVATVSDVIQIAQTPQGLVWNANTEGGELPYTANNSPSEILTGPPLPQQVFPSTMVTMAEQATYKKLTVSYGRDDDVLRFKAKVMDLIRSIDSTKEMTSEEKQFVSLSGFLALTFCRAATKNRAQMSTVFLKVQYKANIAALTSWPNENPWSPPCKASLDLVCTELVKGLSTTSALFTVFAYEFVQTMKDEYVNPSVRGYLAAAVLTHTSQHGLGILQLVDQACLILNVDWTLLRKHTLYDKTRLSWQKIATLKSNNFEYGFQWANIINDGYFQDFSCKENLFLSAVLAGVIENQQGEGIWRAPWAKDRKLQLDTARKIGKALFNQFQSFQEIKTTKK